MVPTIGSLFLLNAIGCAVVGFTLLMPIERAQRAALVRAARFGVVAAVAAVAPRHRRGLVAAIQAARLCHSSSSTDA
jgi:hypothetical protein